MKPSVEFDVGSNFFFFMKIIVVILKNFQNFLNSGFIKIFSRKFLIGSKLVFLNLRVENKYWLKKLLDSELEIGETI